MSSCTGFPHVPVARPGRGVSTCTGFPHLPVARPGRGVSTCTGFRISRWRPREGACPHAPVFPTSRWRAREAACPHAPVYPRPSRASGRVHVLMHRFTVCLPCLALLARFLLPPALLPPYGQRPDAAAERVF